MKATALAEGYWPPGAVGVSASATVWTPGLALAEAIDAEWEAAGRAKGRLLFDGPMCRVDSFSAGPERLELRLSVTSYKPFYVLHMARPDLLPSDGGARPLGVSSALVSADGKLLFGRRGAGVAYYPGRVHPFAGSMEPGERDPFETLYRELEEELGLQRSELHSPAVLGLIEDPALRHPEAVIAVRTPLLAEEVRARLDGQEHDAMVAVAVSDLESFLGSEELTPVCHGTALLWWRREK